MNKKDLAKELSKKTLLNQQEASDAVEILFDAIENAVLDGDEVIITGFGKFYPYKHKPRPVRNPKTQEDMVLKQTNVLKFKISTVLKNKFKESNNE